MAEVRLLVEGVESTSEACDWISETLRGLQGEGLKDWGYVSRGQRVRAYPSKVLFNADEYEEGDLMEFELTPVAAI